MLVPGQLFSPEILEFMRSLDTPEVHGYVPQAGYRVYTSKALEIAQDEPCLFWLRHDPPPLTNSPAGGRC